ncbi:GLYCOSYL TRANSFERASE-RELATED [Salix purpurea]|uniref:UDP-N-acetylglucosamine transferase subunit ALG14 n=1 Tax=Salix purpurea TaxID=77065 RepID=A0A9Q1A183_SALPP|nr:GLYCOSYL TRANSFERASE-RELATED [Salix purpurea]
MTIASLFTPSIITVTVSAVLIAITRVFYILCQSGKPLYPSKSPKTTQHFNCFGIRMRGKGGSTQFLQIYRSREVGQSYITSIGTTFLALVHALWLMIRIRPQVVLCNGPGTCVPLCVIAFLFKVVGVRWSSVFTLRA